MGFSFLGVNRSFLFLSVFGGRGRHWRQCTILGHWQFSVVYRVEVVSSSQVRRYFVSFLSSLPPLTPLSTTISHFQRVPPGENTAPKTVSQNNNHVYYLSSQHRLLVAGRQFSCNNSRRQKHQSEWFNFFHLGHARCKSPKVRQVLIKEQPVKSNDRTPPPQCLPTACSRRVQASSLESFGEVRETVRIRFTNCQLRSLKIIP